MRRLKCFGLVFTLLAAVSALYLALLPQDVRAIEVTIDVEPTGKVLPGTDQAQCAWSTDTWIDSTSSYCIIVPNSPTAAQTNGYDTSLNMYRFYGIRRKSKVSLKKNHYYDFYIRVDAVGTYVSTAASEPMLQFPTSISANLRVVRFEQVTTANGLEQVGGNSIDYANCTVSPDGSMSCTINDNAGNTEKAYIRFYHIIMQYTGEDTSDGYFQLGGTLPLFRIKPDPQNSTQIRFQLLDAIEFKPTNAAEEMNEKDNEDRNNIESQKDSTQSDSEQAESDMEQGTSSLIGAISSFSAAMAGVHTTNCRLPEISAYNFSLGQIDLCTFSPPSWIQTVTSVLVSLITIKLAYRIFKRIMNIAKGLSG